MKTWLYFYIEYTVKYGKPFYKEIGWSLPFVGRLEINK